MEYNEVTACYRRPYQAGLGECDRSQNIKLSFLLRQVSEIAGEHYTTLGMDYDFLLAHNFVFLLSRIHLTIFTHPKARQRLWLETWECEPIGTQFARDCEIKDEDGKLLVSVSTTWLLVNPETRKIIRPKDFSFWDSQFQRKPTNAVPQKLKLSQSMCPVGERTVRYSDIDANGHVNNAVYGDIACDFCGLDLIANPIQEFEINYKNEARLGQDMVIYREMQGNCCDIRGQTDHSICFEAKIICYPDSSTVE